MAQGDRRIRMGDWTRRKAAVLLQRLALERRLVKDKAIDFLWPDKELAAGSNNLYRTVHALRQTLNKGLGPDSADTVFSFADGILALDENVWVDVQEFEELSSKQNASTDELQRALELYKSELLADDPYSDWLQLPREALSRLYRRASIDLASRYGEQQEFERAVTLMRPLLKNDPADEVVHRELIRFLALNGRRHDAMRQYQACVRELKREMGIPPEPETVGPVRKASQ